MTDNSEPPKPITQLAVPVDRAGPRGRNALGDRAAVYATLAWAMAVGGFVYLLRSPAYLPYILPTSLASCGLAAVVVALSIVALVRAGSRHLDRRTAASALVAGVLLLAAAATAYLLRSPLGELIAGR
jgi:uncharacterized membrane protein